MIPTMALSDDPYSESNRTKNLGDVGTRRTASLQRADLSNWPIVFVQRISRLVSTSEFLSQTTQLVDFPHCLLSHDKLDCVVATRKKTARRQRTRRLPSSGTGRQVQYIDRVIFFMIPTSITSKLRKERIGAAGDKRERVIKS